MVPGRPVPFYSQRVDQSSTSTIPLQNPETGAMMSLGNGNCNRLRSASLRAAKWLFGVSSVDTTKWLVLNSPNGLGLVELKWR